MIATAQLGAASHRRGLVLAPLARKKWWASPLARLPLARLAPLAAQLQEQQRGYPQRRAAHS